MASPVSRAITAARTMLDDPHLPTAVIGFNDEVAVSVLETLLHADTVS